MPKPVFDNDEAKKLFIRKRNHLLNCMEHAPELFTKFLDEQRQADTGAWLDEIISLIAISQTIDEGSLPLRTSSWTFPSTRKDT